MDAADLKAGRFYLMKNQHKKFRLPVFLKSLFWEIDSSNLNYAAASTYIIKRILEHGDEQAIRWMRERFEKRRIIEVLCGVRDLSRRSANLWTLIFGVDRRKIKCLNKYYLKIRKDSWPY